MLHASKEKNFVAVTSVFAAVFLTSFKLGIGLWTNSLGLLSEALHSALDLVAAVITMFAVRYADRPADEDHNFGHGKIENISALVETFLLMITCVWILYEAGERIIGAKVIVEVNVWSYIVVITSIIIDFSRSRALMKVAKKYDSQALEADALHFQTDIWSSMVVFIGLIGAHLGMHYADPVAAMFVAIIVSAITYKLGRKTFDDLIDKAPDGLHEQINMIVSKMSDVTAFHDVKIRVSGAIKFVELNIHVERTLSIEQAHAISEKVEEAISSAVKNAKVTVHIEPETNE